MSSVDEAFPLNKPTSISPEEYNNQLYSTPGHQILSTIEGAGQGVLGPGMTAIESGLNSAGISGFTPEDQAIRTRANPLKHYGSEAAAFAGSMLLGTGEAGLAAKAGSAASKLGEAAGITSHLAQYGIKAGAEVAALQAGSELSKMINQDPAQTLGSAAINVGLAGLLGGAAGVGFGKVGDMFKGSIGKAEEFVNDMKERVNYRQMLESQEPQVPVSLRAQFEMEQAAKASDEATMQRPGHLAGDWAFDHGRETLEGVVSKGTASAAGSIAGAMVGHPVAGAYIGKQVLTPIMEAITKPVLESATNAIGLKGSIDYLANAVKGAQIMGSAVKGLVNGAEVLPQHLIPTEKQREQLKTTLSTLKDPEQIGQLGGEISHYLPSHQTALGALVGQTKSVVDSNTPSTQAPSLWQGTKDLTPLQQSQYNRLLDIAQQPLMPLHYANEGTLTYKDIAAFNQMHPAIAKAVTQKLGQELVEAKTNGKPLSYARRSAISKLMGNTLDVSHTSKDMQAIIASQGPQQVSNKVSAGKALPKGHTTQAQLKSIDMNTKIAATRSQARDLADATGKA